MNKFFSCLSIFSSVGIPLCIAVAMTNKLWVWIVTIISATLIIALIGSIVYINTEKDITKTTCFNKILYFFSPKSKEFDYVYLTIDSTFKIISNTDRELINNFNIKVKKTGFQTFPARFCWKENSDYEVSPTQPKQKIGNSTENENYYKIYDINFDHSLSKNQTVLTGFNLKHLVVEAKDNKPFLSFKIDNKTKFLKLTAEFDLSVAPKTAEFVIYGKLDHIEDSNIIYREPINVEIGNSNATIEKRIQYPRRGRRYAIRWSYTERNS